MITEPLKSIGNVPASTLGRETTAAQRAVFRAIPKVELHCHLLGAVRRETFAAMVRERGAPITEAEIAAFYARGSKPIGVLRVLRALERYLLLQPDDFRRITYEYLQDAAAETVRHAEFFWNPTATIRDTGLAYGEVQAGILAGVREAAADFGISALLIPSIDREAEASSAVEMVEQMLAHRDPAVPGIGIDYRENDRPPELFREAYALARRNGLKTTAHAGEFGMPWTNVQTAVELLEVDRIDHGYTIVDNPDLARRYADRGVLFTVVPTNLDYLRTLEPERWAADHPIRAMSELGLKLHPNTDDPTLHNVSPAGAWELMHSHLGYDVGDLRRMMLNGAEGSWADDDQRAVWRAQWPAEFDALVAGNQLARAGDVRPVSAEGLTASIIRQSRAAAVDIPEATLEMAGLCILDWFGLALGGASEPATRLALQVAAAEGATPAASVVGAGRGFSARQAALVNGVAGHALDYDDVNLAMHVHPTAVILPGLLALAQARRLSGRAVIEAFVAGYEAAGMIGTLISASHYARGFHATGTIGAFGAAAACAYLLGLDEEATARAYGLAGSQAAGLKAQFGTMTKSLHAGRAAEAGVMSALWAQAGMSARPDILEHPRGFAATQSDGPPVEAARWTGYALDHNLFKYHAACFGVHGTLEAMGALRREGLIPEIVRAIRVKVDAGADAMCNIAAPRTGLEAKFSLRFNAALALHGVETSNIATYEDAIVSRPDLERARSLCVVELAPSGWPENLTEVSIETADGHQHVRRHDVSLPLRGLAAQRERLQAKFLNLVTPIAGSRRAHDLMAEIGKFAQLEAVEAWVEAAMACRAG